jgi:hypothetical protein
MEADSLGNNTDHMTEWQDMNLSPAIAAFHNISNVALRIGSANGVVSLAIWLRTMQGPPYRKGGCLEP